ncbi:MAG: hypothetical protein HC913_15205 [Microscillaceae bacterium]|nr:hypothetical protein [Microscillaceae bacterium]
MQEKQIIYESEVFKIELCREKDLLVQHWFGPLNEEKYKANMKNLVQHTLNNTPIYRMLVFPHTSFVISPALQEWTNQHVFEAMLENPLQRVAFVFPEAFRSIISIEQLAIEQTMDEDQRKSYQTNYFFDRREAETWLLDNI